jgi:arsenite-transporting ATPase
MAAADQHEHRLRHEADVRSREGMMWGFIEQPTRFLFFTGKGGVGKTSVACATAVALADAGQRVLLVSTDPASNLAEVLGVTVGGHPTDVPGVTGLAVMNVDPEAEAAAYRDRTIGPYRGVLPDDAVKQMEEQLSGACTVEVAAFDAFTGLLVSDERTNGFDHIVFDTAPTGHTLRLLQLPAAWSGFLDTNTAGASCLGPRSGLEGQRKRFTAAVAALKDAKETTLVLVTRLDRSALAEADRTSGELHALGIDNQRLFVNAVFQATVPSDAVAAAWERRANLALADLPSALAGLPRDEVPLQRRNVVGVETLRAFAQGTDSVTDRDIGLEDGMEPLHPLSNLVDEIAAPGRGLVLVMGKGGVGKTTVAAAVAVELAARGHGVHLSTTDPAAHLSSALAAEVPGLTVDRIDPVAETKAYTEHVLATAGKDLDAEGRALLEEDLKSPCTEEVAVFHAFSKLVRESKLKFVVLDTAPTGHTLLLLDAAGSYHREVLRTASPDMQDKLATPMMQLRDPDRTKVLIVTLPETTPVDEAARLQADLRRAEIEPFAWVINQSLAATETRDPVLASRAAAERQHVDKVRRELAARTASVAWQPESPVGPEHLRILTAGPVSPSLA